MNVRDLWFRIRRQGRRLRRSESRKRLPLKTLAIAGLITVSSLMLIGAFGLTIALAWISRDLPDPNTLINRSVAQTTKIYDRTGTHLLYEIHGDQNRTLIQIKDLPSYVPKATVSIEDKNFYNHHGIDWLGLVRAFIKNTLRGQRISGTSTLTQQLVKNAILTNERSLTRKLKEILLSLQLERVFTKDQILQLYLNEIPYGSTTYGIESATRGYFGKPAKELTVDEAALLAAIPQAPDLYSPYGTGLHGDNRTQLVGRQHYILDQMATQGYITREQADEAKKIDTLKKIIPKNVGKISAPHFVMYVRSQLLDTYGQDAVERGGLNVITTLDWDKQQIAQDEVAKGVDARGAKYQFTNAALVALDPKNGQILSMVGSKDFFDAEHDGQVNVVLSPRQPGSSFKPIVYTAGFLKGYTPDTTLWDVNTTFKTDLKDYSPRNYDLKEHGPVSVRTALQGSLNIAAVKMLYLVGISRVLDFAEQLGYTTLSDRSRFGLSLVLGGGEVKLLEHANAYAAFANNGVQFPTAAILKVTDPTGKVLQEWTTPQGNQVVDADATHKISSVLSDNNARAYVFGARNNFVLPGRPAAAKSGTTNNFHDAWTLGYTPSLVAGVWVGNNDNTEMKRGADGSQIAAPIWQGFMTRALASSTIENFPSPPPSTATKPVLLGKDYEARLKIDKSTGKLATEFTPPELIEERTFHIAHDTLYYLDKDDPAGPQPTDPGQDPQFYSWEGAVQDWVKRTGWNATSSPPTETDDVHTAANIPQVSITSPQANSLLTNRQFTVSATIGAPRRITHVDVTCEGQLIGTKQFEPWNIPVQIPNSIANGYHDIVVTAYDDVANHGRAGATINLSAETSNVTLRITNVTNGAALNGSNFPMLIQVQASEAVGAQKIDLFLQAPDGTTRPVGTTLSPGSTQLEFSWTTNPGQGTYKIYPVLTDQGGATHSGEQTTVNIGQ